MIYEGLRIKCPYCKRSDFNETTEKFDPNAVPTGAMVRLQAKWRKQGMRRWFGDNCLTYQIVCGFCGGALVKNKRLTLADPLPDAESAPEETSAINSVMPFDEPAVEEDPVAVVEDNRPEEPAIMVAVEDRDGTAVVTTTVLEDNQPSPEMVAAYRKFKSENPESTWKEAWLTIPNEYSDHKAFARYMREALKEL